MSMHKGSVTGHIRERSIEKVFEKVLYKEKPGTYEMASAPHLYGKDAKPEDYGRMVYKAANILAAKGANPQYAGIHLLVPEDAKESLIKTILSHIKNACEDLQMGVYPVEVEVSDLVLAPVCSVMAYGEPAQEIHTNTYDFTNCQIVMSKWIAPEGTYWMARKYKDKIQSRLPQWIVDEGLDFEKDLSVMKEVQIAREHGVVLMHAVGEGGIFRALRELGDENKIGFEVDLHEIPVRQETIEMAEVLNLNPYELNGFGALLMVTDKGKELVEELEKASIPSKIIGKTTNTKDKTIIHGEDTRYIEVGIVDSWWDLKRL